MVNSNAPRYSYLSHLLITIGVLLLSIFIFNALSEMIALKLFHFKPSDIEITHGKRFELSEVYALQLSQFALGLSFLVTVFISIKVFRKDFWQFTTLQTAVPLGSLLLAIILYVAFVPANNWIILANDALQLPSDLEKSLREMEQKSDVIYQALLSYNSGYHLMVNLLVMAVIPAVSEELLFRGVFLRIFKSWTNNIHLAVIFTSLLFAALHFQPYKLAPMFLLSALFCYIFYLSGSIWIPIILHGVNNALVVIAESLASGTDTGSVLRDEFAFPLWSVLLSLVITGTLFALFWKFSRSKLELAFE